MAKEIEREYVRQSSPTKISATSRVAIHIQDNYYTIEASEERAILDAEAADIDKEWNMLFDELNDVIDGQCSLIVDTFAAHK